MTTIYGIPNCDSVKKARKWLEAHDVAYTFIDVRNDTPSAAQIEHWISVLGPERMVNKRSTTWKNMSDEARLLKIANKINIGPKFIKNSKNFLVMELIDGEKIIDWAKNSKTKSKEVTVPQKKVSDLISPKLRPS